MNRAGADRREPVPATGDLSTLAAAMAQIGEAIVITGIQGDNTSTPHLPG